LQDDFRGHAEAETSDACLRGRLHLFGFRWRSAGERTVLAGIPNQPVEPTLKTTALLFILLAIGVVSMQAWFLRRIIREFTYDGTTLQFRTLARSEPQTRVASQVLAVRDWAGRGGLNGYKLMFRDAPRAYLENDTTNTALLIEHLLRDMPRDR